MFHYPETGHVSVVFHLPAERTFFIPSMLTSMHCMDL